MSTIMADPTDGNWGSSSDNSAVSARLSSGKRRATGPGFYSYLQDQLNRSGGLQPRKGTTAAFKGGDLDGMNQAQAESHLADKYSNLGDDEAQHYEPATMTVSPSQPASPATAAVPTYAGPSPSPYGSNPNADLARLRSAGVVGANQTISDPDAFKSAVSKLDSHVAAYQKSGAPVPTAPARMGSVAFDPTGLGSVGGTINGAPANSVIADLKAQNAATDASLGRPAVPTIGQQPDGSRTTLAADGSVQTTPAPVTPSAMAASPAATPSVTPPPASTPAPSTTQPAAVVAPASSAPVAATPAPGLDAPGGLNDQLEQQASAAGAAVNAKKASDNVAAHAQDYLNTSSLSNPPAVAGSWPIKPDGSWQPPAPNADPAGPVTPDDQSQFQKNTAFATSLPAAPVPSSGGGMAPSDASGTANKYAGPTPTPAPPSPDDIDPATGKKRVATASL